MGSGQGCRKERMRLLTLSLLMFGTLMAQKPEIIAVAPAVNPFIPQRNYAYGDVISVYGKYLSSVTQLVPFDQRSIELADTRLYYIPEYRTCPEMQRAREARDPLKVLPCGTPLELVYVSPAQINAVLPWSGDSSGKLFRNSSGDYHGFLVLAKQGKADIYLQRMYPDSDDWWNIYPFDLGIGAKPNFVVRGFVKPFTSLSQPHELYLTAANTLLPHAAITHADYSEVNAQRPVGNGETVTLWITGTGDMLACGASIVCAPNEKAEAMRPYIGFQHAGRSYYFPTQTAFIGAAADFPWLQQINARISLCAEGQSTVRPLALNAQLYFQHFDSSLGWTTAPGGYAVSLPLVVTGSAEQGATGFYYESIPGIGGGRWRAGCLKY